MLGLIITIIIVIIMLVGVIYYFTLKNNGVHDKYVNEMMNHNNFKKNALNHITNSLLEIDYLNSNNGNLGSNENSTCYKKNGSIIKNCKCHGSCETCGYGDTPNGINQCLKCKNGSKVNKLYNNGAGWCSMITNDEVSGDYSFSKNEATANEATANEATSVPAAKDKIEMTCNQRFMNMCGASSNWGECLEKNKKSLLLSGCNIELDKSQVSDSSTAKNIGMVKKTKLDKDDDKLLANHFLQSENSQHKLQITNNGHLIIKSGATGKPTWKSGLKDSSDYPVKEGPYHLKLHNDMSLVLANAKGTTVWEINPSCRSTTEPCYGPNLKVILTNSGNLQIKDNSNIVRWSSVPNMENI